MRVQQKKSLGHLTACQNSVTWQAYRMPCNTEKNLLDINRLLKRKTYRSFHLTNKNGAYFQSTNAMGQRLFCLVYT